jgi:hypothetical protein
LPAGPTCHVASFQALVYLHLHLFLGYMLTAENEGYNSAKEERVRKENELVHRVMHSLFHKIEEQLREHDSKVSKETEEQKRKTR